MYQNCIFKFKNVFKYALMEILHYVQMSIAEKRTCGRPAVLINAIIFQVDSLLSIIHRIHCAYGNSIVKILNRL